MAINKKYLKTKNVCKVTFQFPSESYEKASLVGDFNNWDTTSHPLKKLKKGAFKIELPLDAGKVYEFKYVVDGNYVNEEEADKYVWNDFANSENSVLVL